MTNRRLPVVAVVISFILAFGSALDFRYHNFKEMAQFLQDFNRTHTNLSRLYDIGKSVEDRNLYVVEVTALKDTTQLGVPNVKLIGNIHGNEAVGREVLLHFLEYLVDSYESDDTVQWLLNNTRIHILPSLNPDGFERSSEGLCTKGFGRENAHAIDLNRSFPDFFRKNARRPEQETRAVQKWMNEIPFILSASLHGGALVANYPYENSKEYVWEAVLRRLNETRNHHHLIEGQGRLSRTVTMPHNPPSISPDDDVFVHLAKVYANQHPTMHLGKPCQEGGITFADGITNGAAWYAITGGMQDYNYFAHGCMEITLEISCCKYPERKELQRFWNENKLPLLEYVSQAHRGVTGQIIDGLTNIPIKNATLKITNRNITFHSTNHGEFWRLLLPGIYAMEVKAEGYQNLNITFAVKKYISKPKLTALKVQLLPLGYEAPEEEKQSSMLPTESVTQMSSSSSQGQDTFTGNTVDVQFQDVEFVDAQEVEDIGPAPAEAVKSGAFVTSFSYFFAVFMPIFIGLF